MRWGRVEWLLAIAYAMASFGFSAVLFHDRSSTWRYEYARAADGAALYLFALAPALCACTAIASQRRQAWLEGVRSSLRDPSQPGRSAAWRFIGWACAVHALIVIAALWIARAAYAFPVYTAVPLLLPVLLIVLAATGGAVIGTWSRSPVVPVLVGVVTFLTAFISQLGVRELLMVGGGYFDYAFWSLTPHAVAAVGLLAGAGFLVSVRRPGGSAARVLTVLVVNLAAAAGLLSMLSPGPTRHQRQHAEDCLAAEVAVCAPPAYTNAAAQVQGLLELVDQVAPGILDRRFPRQRVELTPAEGAVPEDGIGYDSSMIGHQDAAARSVVDAVSLPGSCDPATVPRSNFLASAVVQGWLGRRMAVAVQGAYQPAADGSFPTSLVSALEALPVDQQTDLVGGYLDAIAACGPVDLGLIDPGGEYAD